MNKIDPDKDGTNPVILGDMYKEALPILSYNDKYTVVRIHLCLEYHVKDPYYILGDIRLYPAKTYDAVIFALFRKHYGLSYPQVFGLNYIVGTLRYPCIALCNIIEETPISEEMYYPPTGKNYLFRFNLALIAYFCRFVGVPISMAQIQVRDGVPYIWNIHVMGIRNSKSFPLDILAYLFGVTNQDWSLVEGGNSPRCLTCTSSNPTGFDFKTNFNRNCPVNAENEELDPSDMMPIGSMAHQVVKYMRDIDFDLEIFRQYIFLRDNAVRQVRNAMQKYRTNNAARDIGRTLESNYAYLTSSNPFGIFSKTSIL